MKKLSIVAITVVALVFGSVAWASAIDWTATNGGTVNVTATVNPAFEITTDVDSVAFGALDIGAVESVTGPTITVKSNKAYTYTAAAPVVTLGPDAASETLIATKLGSSSVAGANGALDGTRGVSSETYTYSVDLSGDDAYNLEAGAYEWEYEYTAVQN
jgi:hypothetical protein